MGFFPHKGTKELLYKNFEKICKTACKNVFQSVTGAKKKSQAEEITLIEKMFFLIDLSETFILKPQCKAVQILYSTTCLSCLIWKKDIKKQNWK